MAGAEKLIILKLMSIREGQITSDKWLKQRVKHFVS